MSQSGGNNKAFFKSVDEDRVVFTVQYNPKEFKVDKALTWQETQTAGQSTNFLQFQKGAPMTASFDLVFDTTGDDPAQNVQKVWVEPLLALTNADIQPSDGEAANIERKRPRVLLFSWGEFSMTCVIESVNTTYLMFSTNGQALRARCSLKLKEWSKTNFQSSSSGGSTWGADKVQLLAVRGGQTLSQVAAENGVDMRDLAEANAIDDPMADLTGVTLIIPC